MTSFVWPVVSYSAFNSSSRSQLISSKLHQLVLLTVHSVVAPSGELRGKGRCGVFAGKLCDPSDRRRLDDNNDETDLDACESLTYSIIILFHSLFSKKI